MKAPRHFGGEGPSTVFTAVGLEKQTGNAQPLSGSAAAAASRLVAGWPHTPAASRSPSRFCKGQMLSAFTLSSLVAEKVHPLAPIPYLNYM